MQALTAYREALLPGAVGDFRVDGLDRLGVPVVATDFLGDGEPGFSGFGYGAELTAAQIGGYGELAESVLLTRALRPLTPTRGSYLELREARGDAGVCDPRTLCLPAGSSWTPEQVLTWLPMTRWSTGEQVLVPADWVAARGVDLPGEAELITPITNGLGAGDSVERALSHALLELIQRDGNSVSYRALDEGRVIDLDGVESPAVTALVEAYAAAGITVLPKLAGAPLGIPSVYVVGIDHDPATPPLAVSACGEAADPHLPTALTKALLEYASSRSRKVFAHGPWSQVERVAPADYLARELAREMPEQEPRALSAMRQWTQRSAAELTALLTPTVLSRQSVVGVGDIASAPAATTPEQRLELVLTALAGFDVLVMHTVASPGVHVVKAVVPGLEVETMSYGRIGPRGVTRLQERDSELVALGDRPGPGWAAVLAAPGSGTAPAWLDREGVDRAVGELYALYREPSRHAVARLGPG